MEEESSYIDQISFKWKRGVEAGPEVIIANYYSNVNQEIGMIRDSTERLALSALQQSNQGEFQAQIKEKPAMCKKLFELEMQINQRIQKLKIKKTLTYVKDY